MTESDVSSNLGDYVKTISGLLKKHPIHESFLFLFVNSDKDDRWEAFRGLKLSSSLGLSFIVNDFQDQPVEEIKSVLKNGESIGQTFEGIVVFGSSKLVESLRPSMRNLTKNVHHWPVAKNDSQRDEYFNRFLRFIETVVTEKEN